MQSLKPFAALCLALAISTFVHACDACKLTDTLVLLKRKSGIGEKEEDLKYRWTSDTSVEYRDWNKINPSKALEINDRPHGHMHDVNNEYFFVEHIGYQVNADLEVGIGQGYRHLNQQNVEDPLLLGHHETSDGITDLELDARWRFKKEVPDGFPVDLSLYGILKPPTGQTNERTPEGELIDAENQPGTGSWDGTLGMLAAKHWGKWGATASVSGTVRGTGTQDFKAGDLIRVAFTGTRLVSPDSWGCKIFAGLGVQGYNEFKGREDGEIDRNHGGQFIFAIPQVSVSPIDRVSLTLAVPIPLYQEVNGTHQKQDFGIQFNMGIRF